MDRFAALVNNLVAVFSHSQRPPAFSETEIEMNHYIVKIRESRWHHTSGHTVMMSWWVSGPPPPPSSQLLWITSGGSSRQSGQDWIRYDAIVEQSRLSGFDNHQNGNNHFVSWLFTSCYPPYLCYLLSLVPASQTLSGVVGTTGAHSVFPVLVQSLSFAALQDPFKQTPLELLLPQEVHR